MNKKPPEILENFILGKTIGQGSYATVRFAIEKETNKKYAVKIYENYKLVDPQKKRNLQREISIIKSLDHPCIIKLYKMIKSSSSVFLLKDYSRFRLFLD
jgi:serine/threonine protein kinase